MLAVIEVGGKQYRVAPDQIVYVDLTGKKIGEEFKIPEVLLVQNGSEIKIGQPYVEKATVKAKILEEVKADKIKGFKYKKRKKYRRAWGHRQKYHKLQILSISA